MTTVEQLCTFFAEFTPLRLAEEWDNVGLLVGDRQWPAERIMTCLTVTPESVAEAVSRDAPAEKADVIVTHHPFPFRPLKRLTTDSSVGRMLLELAEHRIAVYSPHTAFDSAERGINQRWAEGIKLEGIQPLIPTDDQPSIGAGRFGKLPKTQSLVEVCSQVKQLLGVDFVRAVGSKQKQIRKVAIACGSAGEFLRSANRQGCDLLITGETTFHTCLEAEATDIALILTGHYWSERFAVEALVDEVLKKFSNATVWASRAEADPLWQV